jgi:hypothetical protein
MSAISRGKPKKSLEKRPFWDSIVSLSTRSSPFSSTLTPHFTKKIKNFKAAQHLLHRPI